MHPSWFKIMVQMVIIGPFPDPMQGAAFINQCLAEEAKKRMIPNEVIVLSSKRSGLLYHFERLFRTLSGAWRVAFKNKRFENIL